jgi:hypothetical protein
MKVMFISIGSIGCTFLDWSFHYLSKNKFNWLEQLGIWNKIVKNPLRENDCHYHLKSHCGGLKKCNFWIEKFSSYTEDKDFSFYCGFSSEDSFHNITINRGFSLYDTIGFALERGIRVIFLYCDSVRIIFINNYYSMFYSKNRNFNHII